MKRFAFLLLPLAAQGSDRPLTFEKDIRPIVKAHCMHCHGEEEKPGGGVDLRLRRFMDDLIVPGHPSRSKLVEVIRTGEMPKKGKPLSDAEIHLIENWITLGARTARPEPAHLPPGPVISEEDRSHWAFQPVKRPAIPAEMATDHPVDALVRAQLKDSGLTMAPEADRRTLIRRVTLDLTGLVPSPAEVDAFLADSSPSAYSRLVDRLLASPAYGERWARHWLDIAGYSDSNGYTEVDSVRPEAWRYRDYVIRSLNEDKPWDRFIQEQLAGDELAAATHTDFQQAVLDPRRTDQLIATAFLRMAPDGTGDPVDDAKLASNNVIAEQIKILGSSLMGLTLSCAQCHDHRYDPITQLDYYRFRAIFDPAYDWQNWRAPGSRRYSLYTPAERAKAAEIEVRAKAIETEARAMSKKFLDEIFEIEIKKVPQAEQAAFRIARDTPPAKQTPQQKALIKKYPSALATYALDLYDKKKQDLVNAKMAEATKLRATKPTEGFIMALTEVKGRVPVSHLFNRGDHEQPRTPVTPGELGILSVPAIEPLEPVATGSGSSGRRLAYARWLTSGQHPLTARVLVNRFWMHHMGRGLVNTPGDFGRQGEAPTHPALLDYLADEFVRGGWKLKPLHRLIVLSAAYRQSSVNPGSVAQDPENRFYARFKMRRLDAESLRDSMLAMTGTLVRTSFGPPSSIGRDPQGRVVTGIDKGDIRSHKVDPGGEADFRRSIYVQMRRSKPLTVLDTFDAPVMQPNCEMRAQTTVAPQSLLLMNDTFVLDCARRLAIQVESLAPGDRPRQIQQLWNLVYGRPAGGDDIAKSLAYLGDQTSALTEYHRTHPAGKATAPDPAREAMASLCQVLCSSNRFLYIE
jgi:hypothetical protein